MALVDCIGHPGYFVGDDGFIYSNKRGGELRQLRYQWDQDGYAQVTLSTNGKLHTIKVQRLVAQHYLGPKPDGMVVCHGPAGKPNNSVGNLRYDTQKENIADIQRFGNPNPPVGSLNGKARVNEEIVVQMRNEHAAGVVIKDLAIKFGLSPRQTRDIINRRYWKHVA